MLFLEGLWFSISKMIHIVLINNLSIKMLKFKLVGSDPKKIIRFVYVYI